MSVVKGAVDRSPQGTELLAREACWIRMSYIGAELERQTGQAHRVLAQLWGQGRAKQDIDPFAYLLTSKFSVLGQRYFRGLGLPGLVRPILDEVAAHCREVVRPTVVSAGPVTSLASMTNERATEPALRGGLGKAAASVCGAKAITSIGQLIPELELTGQRGYGLVLEEAEPGVAAWAVAAPSLSDGTVVATTSIAGPVMRVQPERYHDFYALLKKAASKLGAVWPRQSVGANVSEAAWI